MQKERENEKTHRVSKSLGRKCRCERLWRRFTWRASGFRAWMSVLVCGFLNAGVEIRAFLLQRATRGNNPSGECCYRSVFSFWVPFLKPEKFWILDEGSGAFLNDLWPFFATYQSKAYKHTRFLSQNDLRWKILYLRTLQGIFCSPRGGLTSPRPCTHPQLCPKADPGTFSGCRPVFFLAMAFNSALQNSPALFSMPRVVVWNFIGLRGLRVRGNVGVVDKDAEEK